MTPPVDARRALEQALKKADAELTGTLLAKMDSTEAAAGTVRLKKAAQDLLHALSAERPETPEVVVCAAIRCANGYIIRGHRHDSCFRTLEGIPDEANPGFDRKWENQGFMTTRNRYVTREEACALQRAAGLISAQTGQPLRPDTEFIFSEDVY